MSNLKKTVKIKESHLVDLIDNIVNEAISAKKKTSINEMDATMGAGEQDLKVQAEKLINMIKSKVPATYFSNVSKNIVAQREAIIAFVKMIGVEPQNVAKIIASVKDIAKAEPAAAAPMAESKKTVKLSESNLVDLIDGILSEAVEVKKQEWINEQTEKQKESNKLMEAKISKLENALKRITEGK
jgi:hypothetical protein